MRVVRASFRIFTCLALLAMAAIGRAESLEVMTSEGDVLVHDLGNNTKRPVQAKSILPIKNTLITGSSARAVVRLGADGYAVVGEKSQVEIYKEENRPVQLKQLVGKIYYALNSIKGKQNAVSVRTASAVLGVRGTRFLVVETADENEIGMRKGLLNVSSPEGEFEVYKQSNADAFDAFKREAQAAIAQQQREFEAYKANSQREFIEFKREFGLGADRMARFNGRRVVEVPLNEEVKMDMKSFEDYAEEWLKTVMD